MDRGRGGWMDGWMDRWMDKGMDGSGWMDVGDHLLTCNSVAPDETANKQVALQRVQWAAQRSWPMGKVVVKELSLWILCCHSLCVPLCASAVRLLLHAAIIF